ncbi:hypothetical protein BaRGS_00007861 [Batillaria attramentaria]|uniref:Ion transport domain-containing protein n=1 Tax=Batillaria attramentaria TaxID=370345 RepID=A0ABD0LNE0_9CAEN
MEDDLEMRPRKRVRSSFRNSDMTTVTRHESGYLEAEDIDLSLPSQSRDEIFSGIETDDTFLVEVNAGVAGSQLHIVAQKTAALKVGKQEAEIEVIIDRLIESQGDKDRALLHVVSKTLADESKIQVMVNTLLHRGANTSVADADWRTPLHHATRRGFKSVVTKLLDSDALPHVRDREQQMPLHIAISNNADDIAALLLAFMPNIKVRPLFVSLDDHEAELSLHDLLKKNMQQTVLAVLDCMVDAIGQSGHVRVHYHVLEADAKGRPPNHRDFSPTSRSCLHLIAKGGYKNIVYHNVVRLLMRRKWKEFARFRFQMNSFLFVLTQFCLCFSVVAATMTPDPTTYQGPLHIARAVFEVWSVIAAFVTFLLELNQMRKHRLDYFTDKFNWLDISSSSLLLTVVVLRWTHRKEQWPVYSVGFLLWTLRIFKYAAVFRQTGAYAQILYRIVAHDFPQFIVVFSVVLIAFSGAFVLSLRGEDSLDLYYDTSTFWHTMFTGVRILIEGQPVVDYTPEYHILIAQLSDTYQNVQQDAQRGLELNRAWIIARVELNGLFMGKGHRQSKYLEVEEMQNPEEVLEKWENPPLNEMTKHVRDIWDSLESHKLNMLTLKNRMSRQELAMTGIQ